jgi:uncharacterized membrane protein YeaQ/YmgE (transglycosylase-associated protein family)
MFGTVIAVMAVGFVTGALARLAVPGPDPMPAWLTIAIGLTGSISGGVIAVAVWGRKATSEASLLGFGIAILLVVAYRRFYQRRPVVGPDALKFPERGIGIERFRERREKVLHSIRQQQHAQSQQHVNEVNDQIRKLAELHDEGVLTDEEFETKKRELLSQI